MNGDDTGDNISDLAKYFSELSVQYWAWKNADVNYYGLCHYRRYLSFSNKKFDQCSRGYIIENMLNDESIEKYGLNDYDNMAKQIKKYDLITGGSRWLMRWFPFWRKTCTLHQRYIHDSGCIYLIKRT